MNEKHTRKEDPAEHLPDEAIVELFFARDETAITESDRKYGPYLWTVAHNILHNAADCEECRNDTYLRAWETIPPTRPASLGGYLTKIIRGIAINRYDRDRRDRRIPPEAVESLSDFEGFLADTPAPDEAESALIGEVISRYLRGCKKRRRYIFMARFYAARPVAEIAERLGVSRSSVKRELAGIRKELRNELEKEGITV
jgi:RNA polymerase sigma-70 factor (ECF subfamily)